MIKNYLQYIQEGQLEKANMSITDIYRLIYNRTLIIFDTETTGLDPKQDFNMITEIAAMAYDHNGVMLEKFHKKIKLIQPVFDRIERDKQVLDDMKNALPWENGKVYHPDDTITHNGKIWTSRTANKSSEPNKKNNDWKERDPNRKRIDDLLKMTGYYEENTEFGEYKEVMRQFSEWVYSFSSPIIIAQNARFDLYQVNSAIINMFKSSEVKRIDFPVIDTLQLSKYYIVPAIKELAENGDEFGIKAMSIMKGDGKKILNNLNVLGKVFDIHTDMWHSGLADTVQLAGIFFAAMNFLRNNK